MKYFVVSYSNFVHIKNYLYIIFCFSSLLVGAQDVHWSQFNDNPIYQNPGNTGNFIGDYRFTGNFRNQWRSVTVPFNTLSLAADTKFIPHPNLGLGLLFFNDQVGDGKFRTTELQINASYELYLSKDSTHRIRPGINIGMNHRQVNTGLLSYDNQYNGVAYDPNLSSLETFQTDKFTNFSVGLGGVYIYTKNARESITVGLGAFNLNRPNQGFFLEKVQRDIRFNISGQAIKKLDIDWDLLPALQFSIQGKYVEAIIGSRVKYTLVNRNGIYKALYGGIFYRNKDASYLSAGLDYNNWFVGLSYDINISKLTPASQVRGGFELAVRYIIFQLKPKKITHRVCPDYI